MAIQLKEEDGGKILMIHVTGCLVKADYEGLVAEFGRLVRVYGKLRVLFDMTGFHGWDAGAAWEDFKFDLKHFSDIDRLATGNGSMAWQSSSRLSRKPRPATSINQTALRQEGGWPNRNTSTHPSHRTYCKGLQQGCRIPKGKFQLDLSSLGIGGHQAMNKSTHHN
jgi:hypothetical protein